MNLLDSLLTNALHENHLTLSDQDIQSLIHYLELLTAWNRVFNLTAITTPREMVYLHIIDSLVVLPYLQGRHLLDVGTGAGLPGIPLAIVNPNQQWVLLDKNSKKTRFLTQVIAELALTNVQVIKDRIEHFNLTQCSNHQCFDTILSRAFGPIRRFAEKTEHLLCPDGTLLAMKGKYPQEELEDVPAQFLVKDVRLLEIQGIAIKRHIVRLMLKH